MTRYAIAVALALSLAGTSIGQDVKSIDTIGVLAEKGLGKFSNSVPQLIEWLASKDDEVAKACTRSLGKIGVVLAGRDDEASKNLKMTAAKALYKSSIKDKREEVQKAATTALELFTTAEERKLLAEKKD